MEMEHASHLLCLTCFKELVSHELVKGLILSYWLFQQVTK